MSDSPLPNNLSAAFRLLVGNLIWILPMLALENATQEHWGWVEILAGAWIIDVFLAVKWGVLSSLVQKGRRALTMNWVLLLLGFGGAVAIGIALGASLARPIVPVVAQPSTGRIAWNFEQQKAGQANFLGFNRLGQEEMRIINIGAHGKNTSTDPISEFSGYVRSDITNAKLPIYLLAQETDAPPSPFPATNQLPTKPEDTFGIPGLAEFDITTFDKAVVEFGKDGVPASKFIREFGSFTLVLTYDGTTVEEKYSQDDVRKAIERFENSVNPPSTTAPRVTRKPSAPPVPGFALPLLPAPEPSQSGNGKSN